MTDYFLQNPEFLPGELVVLPADPDNDLPEQKGKIFEVPIMDGEEYAVEITETDDDNMRGQIVPVPASGIEKMRK